MQINAGTRAPAIVDRKLAILCAGTGYYCTALTTSCDVLIHGKAYWSYRGKLVIERSMARVEGDRRNAGDICEASSTEPALNWNQVRQLVDDVVLVDGERLLVDLVRVEVAVARVVLGDLLHVLARLRVRHQLDELVDVAVAVLSSHFITGLGPLLNEPAPIGICALNFASRWPMYQLPVCTLYVGLVELARIVRQCRASCATRCVVGGIICNRPCASAYDRSCGSKPLSLRMIE